MTDRPPHGQQLAPGAQLPPKPASIPATPKPTRCAAHVTIDWGTPDDPGPSATFQCELRTGHTGDHREHGAGTWTPGQNWIYRGVVSSIPDPKAAATLPRDLDWARRCAADYTANPTDARARNAAQCLPGILAAYDELRTDLERVALAYRALRERDKARGPAAGGVAVPPELCRAPHPAQARPDLKCYLAAGHTGDHSTNQFPGNRTWRNPTPGEAQTRTAALERLADGLDVPPEIRDPATRDELNAWNQPPELCPGYPQARPEDARLACFKPAGHTGEHSNTPPLLCHVPTTMPRGTRALCRRPIGHEGDHVTESGHSWPAWRRVGIDPCPARSHQQESCVKGYMHSGGHEWGPTEPIEAGPELPAERKCPDFCEANHHKPLTPDEGAEPPTPLELESKHYRDTTRTVTDGKRPCQGRGCTNHTSMSCVRCGRTNCRMCGATNLKTMIHSDGEPCHALTYEQARALPLADRANKPWHFCDESCPHHAPAERAAAATEPHPEG